MQNSIFNKINVSTRILILIILVLSLLIANSIYFILFFSTLVLVLLILTNKSVKFYLDSIKNFKLWLLFSFIAYIIIVGNVLYSVRFIYKVILIILLLTQFSLTITFQSLTNGIKTLLRLFIKEAYLDKISYNVVSFIYFINFYINSKKDILRHYNEDKLIRYSFSFKRNVLPRLFLAASKTKKIESSLKIKFYEPKFENKSTKSNIVLFVFLLLFIIVIFKEVIL